MFVVELSKDMLYAFPKSLLNTSMFSLSQYLVLSLGVISDLCALSRLLPPLKSFLENTLPMLVVKSSAFCLTLTEPS